MDQFLPIILCHVNEVLSSLTCHSFNDNIVSSIYDSPVMVLLGLILGGCINSAIDNLILHTRSTRTQIQEQLEHYS